MLGINVKRLAAAALASAMILTPMAASAGDTVKIGLSVPLTGDWAEYGDFIKKSVQMVIARTNRMGGVRGKQIEVVIADSRGDPKESVLIAEKFVADPEILVEIGDFSSSSCMAAAPIYEKANMAQVSPTSSHPDFTKKGKNMFRVIGTQAAEGPFNAKWAVSDLSAKSVATIYINNDWGVSANKYFVEAAKKLGAKVVAEEAFITGERDFAPILTKIKKANPDVLYLPTFYADASSIMTQARRMHYKPMVLSTGSLYSPELIKMGGKAVEGLLTNAVYFPNDPRPAAQEFTRDFRATYSKDPSTFAAVGYDAANLVIAAMHMAGTEDRAAMRVALESLKSFVGVTGTFDYSKSHDPQKEYARIMVKNAKWVPYEK